MTDEQIERAAEAVHRAWVAEQVRQGTPAHTLEACPMWQEDYGDGDCTNPKPSAHHFNMVPWAELPEDAKEVNRVTARAVLATVQTRVEALEAALQTLHAHVARQSDHLLLGTRSEQMLDNVQANLRAANDDAAQFLSATEQGPEPEEQA